MTNRTAADVIRAQYARNAAQLRGEASKGKPLRGFSHAELAQKADEYEVLSKASDAHLIMHVPAFMWRMAESAARV